MMISERFSCIFIKFNILQHTLPYKGGGGKMKMVENKARKSLKGVKVIHSEEYMKSWFLNNGKSNFPFFQFSNMRLPLHIW